MIVVVNPSTELARVVLAELLNAGVTDVVLAPGSRSAPLALALAAAERRGDLKLHVRIDERSAGFLALGIARIQARPVPVVCTSGTAVANLAPAVVEATYAGVPLIAITADRPPALRKTGANQTIDQVGFFATQVCCAVDIPPSPEYPADPLRWHAQVRRVIAAAAGLDGERAQSPGAVQLNLGFAAIELVGGIYTNIRNRLTVSNDSTADTLQGEGGTDWFWIQITHGCEVAVSVENTLGG